MSYEKQSTAGTIRFYYEIDSIFKKVQRKSSFKAASVKKDDGTADFTRIELSSDAKDLMKDFMYEAMLEVFKEMFSILEGDSIEHDKAFTPDGGSEITVSYADISDNDNYRTINLDLIDKKIENALVAFILFKWYSLKGVSDEAQLSSQEFTSNRVDISELSLTLRQL